MPCSFSSISRQEFSSHSPSVVQMRNGNLWGVQSDMGVWAMQVSPLLPPAANAPAWSSFECLPMLRDQLAQCHLSSLNSSSLSSMEFCFSIPAPAWPHPSPNPSRELSENFFPADFLPSVLGYIVSLTFFLILLSAPSLSTVSSEPPVPDFRILLPIFPAPFSIHSHLCQLLRVLWFGESCLVYAQGLLLAWCVRVIRGGLWDHVVVKRSRIKSGTLVCKVLSSTQSSAHI